MESIVQLPMVALKNTVIMPGMLIHFDISNPTNIKAVEVAMKTKQQVFLIAQKDPDVEEPDRMDLYTTGTIAVVKQMIKLPGQVLRVLVYGVRRAVLDDILARSPFYMCEVKPDCEEEESIPVPEQEAMLRTLKELIDNYAQENQKLGKEVIKQLQQTEDLEQLLDSVAVQIPIPVEDKQRILDAEGLSERYQCVASILAGEIEILQIKKDLQAKVQKKVDKNQKEYIMREQMKVIREELGESDTVADADVYLEQCEALDADESVKVKIRKEIKHFRRISGSSSESAVSRGYIETLLALPWNKSDPDRLDLKRAKKILEDEHYGLEKVKDRVLEFLAVRSLTAKGESPILCLVGPPGTGKTSIARSIAKSLSKRYVRICLGGVRDEAEIRGHRRTYVGALPGRLATALKNAGVNNPLILLDEIDKVSSDYKGDTSSALLEVLDSEQNSRFVDHYVEIPLDLSQVLFIATANSVQTIPRPLLDRMEIIEVNSYTLNEKIHIAKKHLVQKQLKKNGLTAKQLSFSVKALEAMALGYTREAGVRNLERRIGEVCRKAARELLEGEVQETKISVTPKNLEHFLGPVKYMVEKEKLANEVGIVRGLAWTSVGGTTLQIEVNTMPGKGSFELTGQLGDVMKESARAGISYIRSVAEKYGIDKEYFETTDFHIHIPEGSVPKDGPSAGITMATAMLSAITGKKVRGDVAMTGEITLRGRVLPIGGLTEKILAAKTVGIHTVIVPEKNRKDVTEVAEEILEGMTIVYVSTMEEVLETAFCAK